MQATAPTNMKGFRTRSRSDSTPKRTRVPDRQAAYQTLMLLASAVERPKTTTQQRGSNLTNAKWKRNSSEMANEDVIRSSRSIDRNGWVEAMITSLSDSPRALASISDRSCSETMSWSRSCGDSSRRKQKEIATTPKQARPEMVN